MAARPFAQLRRSKLTMLQRLLQQQKWARKMTADAQRKADTCRKIQLGGLVDPD
jgi:hypothetical protein